jgi:hypothetical protein
MEAVVQRMEPRKRDTGNFDVGRMFDNTVMPITITRWNSA